MSGCSFKEVETHGEQKKTYLFNCTVKEAAVNFLNIVSFEEYINAFPDTLKSK